MKMKHAVAHMKAAQVYAGLSTAKRLQVGALYVKHNKPVSQGYNGTPPGECNVCEDENGNTKGNVIHAEENGLRGFENIGESARDSVLFVTHSPCLSCAGRLIHAKIKAVIYAEKYRDSGGIQKLLDNNIPVFRLLIDDEHKIYYLYCELNQTILDNQYTESMLSTF